MLQNQIEPISVIERSNSFYADFQISHKQSLKFDSIIPLLGYLPERNLSTDINNRWLKEINIEISYLKDKKVEYEKELAKMMEKDEKYYVYWEEVRNIDKSIFDLEKRKLAYINESVYIVKLNIFDDAYDLTDRRINWVNMPGASYEILFIENSQTDVSGSIYIGYSLKYMITKGKYHFTLGNLKEFQPETNDPRRNTELFLSLIHI